MVTTNVEDNIPSLYYEADHAMLVNTSKDVQGSLADNTAVSGLGLIVERFTIQEDAYDKPTVVAVVEHCDYDNAPPPPAIIMWLLTSPDQNAVIARKRIRDYNNCLSFTSMVVKHDWGVRGQLGIYNFRVNGQLFHYAGSALPVSEDNPCFAQIYTVGDGGTHEAAMRQHHYDNELDDDLLLKLQDAINARNP
ncbi:hypothetical protein DFH28DRAFT_1135220, partial [Melampsora americana]